MSEKPPSSEYLAIQVLAMPRDVNVLGDIFGGWVISQMDLAAGVAAAKKVNGRCVTIAINSMQFHLPVKVGDLVSCYAEIVKVGTTSVTIKVEAWSRARFIGKPCKVTEGLFTYVAIDKQGKKRVIDK